MMRGEMMMRRRWRKILSPPPHPVRSHLRTRQTPDRSLPRHLILGAHQQVHHIQVDRPIQANRIQNLIRTQLHRRHTHQRVDVRKEEVPSKSQQPRQQDK